MRVNSRVEYPRSLSGCHRRSVPETLTTLVLGGTHCHQAINVSLLSVLLAMVRIEGGARNERVTLNAHAVLRIFIPPDVQFTD